MKSICEKCGFIALACCFWRFLSPEITGSGKRGAWEHREAVNTNNPGLVRGCWCSLGCRAAFVVKRSLVLDLCALIFMVSNLVYDFGNCTVFYYRGRNRILNRNRIRSLSLVAVAAVMVCAQAVMAQVAAGALTWHRELGAAMSDARQSGNSILAFFADQKSAASNKSWAGLYESNIVSVIQTSYVPLLVDWESQRALASQLGVSEPGVAVIYSANGAALKMLTAGEILDTKALEVTMKQAANSASASAVNAQASSANAAAGAGSASVPAQQSSPATASSSEAFADAIPADQVKREQVGQEITITGTVVGFEASGGPRIPFIATLAQRSTDPVEVVYWEQTATEIHAGRSLPTRGDKISAKGTLTDYKGRLQIKVNSPRQIKLH